MSYMCFRDGIFFFMFEGVLLHCIYSIYVVAHHQVGVYIYNI
jgi:hypothetical protein